MAPASPEPSTGAAGPAGTPPSPAGQCGPPREPQRPVPVVLADGSEGIAYTELGAVFHPYLRDYIGDCIDRAGPAGPICPFVARALQAGVMHYTELRVDGRTGPRAVARSLAGYLAWFDAVSRRESAEHPGLVVAFPGPPGPLLPVVAAAHEVVRPAVYARGCTSALFHRDPEEPDDDPRHPGPGYFTAPAPFYVLRRIIPADLQLAMRAPHMFPVYYRLHAAEARRTRLRTAEAAERWNRACREHGLAP